jgi:hypothetical protein
MRLNVLSFALTCGLIWGLGVLLLTWWIIAFEGQTGDLTCLSNIYRGYNVSWSGSLVGLAWALPDGIIGGAVFAWLYNLISGARADGRE